MKRKWVVIVPTMISVLILLFLILVWTVLSRFSSGYEVTDGKVHHRSYSNVNWKVDRKEVVGADPNSFTPISGTGGRYGIDSTSVFFQETNISNADVDSFRVRDRESKAAIDQ